MTTPMPTLDTARRIAAGIEGDAFDAAQATHWWLSEHYDGQADPRYAERCAIGYRPGPMERGPEAESTAADIYAELCAREGCKHGPRE